MCVDSGRRVNSCVTAMFDGIEPSGAFFIYFLLIPSYTQKKDDISVENIIIYI